MQLIDEILLIRTELPKIDIFSADEKARLDECQKLFTAHMKGMLPVWKCCQWPIPIPNEG